MYTERAGLPSPIKGSIVLSNYIINCSKIISKSFCYCFKICLRSKSILRVKRSDVTDAGAYKCVARSVLGYDILPFYVSFKPKIGKFENLAY